MSISEICSYACAIGAVVCLSILIWGNNDN